MTRTIQIIGIICGCLFFASSIIALGKSDWWISFLAFIFGLILLVGTSIIED